MTGPPLLARSQTLPLTTPRLAVIVGAGLGALTRLPILLELSWFDPAVSEPSCALLRWRPVCLARRASWLSPLG